MKNNHQNCRGSFMGMKFVSHGGVWYVRESQGSIPPMIIVSGKVYIDHEGNTKEVTADLRCPYCPGCGEPL